MNGFCVAILNVEWSRPALALVHEPLQLNPSAFSAVRFTSAILTRRLTWLGVSTDSWLRTCASLMFAPAIEAASARAFSARLAVVTSPFSTRFLSIEVTPMFSPGISACSDSRTRVTS